MKLIDKAQLITGLSVFCIGLILAAVGALTGSVACSVGAAVVTFAGLVAINI